MLMYKRIAKTHVFGLGGSASLAAIQAACSGLSLTRLFLPCSDDGNGLDGDGCDRYCKLENAQQQARAIAARRNTVSAAPVGRLGAQSLGATMLTHLS